MPQIKSGQVGISSSLTRHIIGACDRPCLNQQLSCGGWRAKPLGRLLRPATHKTWHLLNGWLQDNGWPWGSCTRHIERACYGTFAPTWGRATVRWKTSSKIRFLRATSHLRNYEGRASLSAWLRGVAINLARNHRSKHCRRSTLHSQAAQDAGELGQSRGADHQIDSIVALYQLLDQVEEHDREVFRAALAGRPHSQRGRSTARLTHQYRELPSSSRNRDDENASMARSMHDHG